MRLEVVNFKFRQIWKHALRGSKSTRANYTQNSSSKFSGQCTLPRINSFTGSWEMNVWKVERKPVDKWNENRWKSVTKTGGKVWRKPVEGFVVPRNLLPRLLSWRSMMTLAFHPFFFLQEDLCRCFFHRFSSSPLFFAFLFCSCGCLSCLFCL